MEPPPAQILVVVANIQARTLKAEGEKGSMRTAIGHGLVGPERQDNSVVKRVMQSTKVNPTRHGSKGNRDKIPGRRH